MRKLGDTTIQKLNNLMKSEGDLPIYGKQVVFIFDECHRSQFGEAQKNVREVLSRLYTGSEIGQGYHGDEDNGEQSAWFLFSSLGFYPLVMGSGEYATQSLSVMPSTYSMARYKRPPCSP